MSNEKSVVRNCDRLLSRLDDGTCQYCDGELETGTYKDTRAVVCRACGTPAVRLW